MPPNHLNYQHLSYFCAVAREGGVVAASEALGLAPSTVSAQVRSLERALDVQLFDRSSRALSLTATGQQVYHYASEIFALGDELIDVVAASTRPQQVTLRVGIEETIPALLSHQMIAPLIARRERVQVVCREDHAGPLLRDLAERRLDVVVLDHPAPCETPGALFDHVIGTCPIGLFATPDLAERYGDIDTLREAPFLLPLAHTSLRALLDTWCAREGIAPEIVAEFEDSELLESFGQRGAGIFPAPLAIADQLAARYVVRPCFVIEDVVQSFYAVSVERRIRHPGVLALTDAARTVLAPS